MTARLSDVSFPGVFPPEDLEKQLKEAFPDASLELVDLTGTLDYRFSRRWSLRTELGTSGGAFDLLWSHRY